MGKAQSIHELVAEKLDLACTYAIDGAFYTSARVAREAAAALEAHAKFCDPCPQQYTQPPVFRRFDAGGNATGWHVRSFMRPDYTANAPYPQVDVAFFASRDFRDGEKGAALAAEALAARLNAACEL